jgi:hypothetical protein
MHKFVEHRFLYWWGWSSTSQRSPGEGVNEVWRDVKEPHHRFLGKHAAQELYMCMLYIFGVCRTWRKCTVWIWIWIQIQIQYLCVRQSTQPNSKGNVLSH